MELKNWTVFGLLDQSFLSGVKIACVFGKENKNMDIFYGFVLIRILIVD